MKFDLDAFNIAKPLKPIYRGFGIGFNSAYNKAKFNLSSINISNGIGFMTDVFAESIIASTVLGIDINPGYNNLEEKVQAEAELALGRFLESEISEIVDSFVVEATMFLNSQDFVETVNGTGTIYSDFQLSSKLEEEVEAEVDDINTYYLSDSISETVSNAGVTAIMFIRNVALAEQIGASAILSQNAMLSGELLETITSAASVAQNIGLSDDIAENINGDVRITSKVSLADELFELVSASADVVVFDEKVCQINVTLKPNDVLIIDASDYTIRLNNKNAIQLHSGDWIDELNRDTVSIDVTASSGLANLSTRVIYTERFL